MAAKTANHEEDYKCLVKGVTEVEFMRSKVPSELLLSGDSAFPLAMNSQGQVLMAASRFGLGRIVVMAHESYMGMFPTLLVNCLTWLGGDRDGNTSVAICRFVQDVADNLSETSFQVQVVEAFSDTLGAGVYVTDAYSVDDFAEDLVAFVKNGGGVLIGGHAWYWFYSHRSANTLIEFEGNKVSGVAGIYFTEHCGQAECVTITPQVPCPWKSLRVRKDFDSDLKFLLQDVSVLDFSGSSVSSEVLVHGTLAFPFGITDEGQPFLAGAYYGLGRVVLVTHEAYLCKEELGQLWTNALSWLDQSRQGIVGVSINFALQSLSRTGFNCQSTNFRDDLSVFVCTTYDDAHAKEIQEFVAQGGGLLIGGHAWHWSLTHSGENEMTDYPGNKILNNMGLSVLNTTISGGVYNVPRSMQDIKDIYLFYHLLCRFTAHMMDGDVLTKHETESLKMFGRDCGKYLRLEAYNWPSYSTVLSTLTCILKKAGMPQPSEDTPVESPEDQLLLMLGSDVYKISPDADIPTSPVVRDQKIKINVKTTDGAEWISTGLYLSPGMKTNVTVPAEMVTKGWKIQIGCQTDYIQHSVLKRAPSVCEQFPITLETTTVQNLWGGLIYLVAPSRTQVVDAEVKVEMAVLAPYYKTGVTTTDDWSEKRRAPAPWAELEGDNIVLTMPSRFVRSIECPEKLMALWQDIMIAIADLAAIPHKLARKERIVIDVQISHGWMHAGYPIMGQNATARELIDTVVMKGSGLWGPIHELGHNQQRSCWEFRPNTTEGTCNLWSVYVHEEVLGMDRAKAHGHLTKDNRKHRIEEYIKGGRQLSDWTVWTALETYLQLQERFGWGAFKKVFADYHEMRNFPSSNEAKMNLYAETFSWDVGMNLTGFFKAWGWPIEKGTEDKLSSLPPWSDHPMA